MAKETKNLKLHQVTRPEDDSKAFNLETILNENWEKLDSAVGDLSQPVTTAEGSAIGLRVQNGRLQYKNNESWTELGLEYEDVKNLAATPAGVITWALPQATDNTRIAIVLCRATKDISNMDYVACLADATITKTTLAQNATSNTYTGLTNSTQYWVKAFVKYALGGKEFYSGGVTVTFTTLAISEVTNLSVNPATELVTWTLPNGSNHTNVEVCYSKTNISGYTYAQCQADSNVTKVELTSTATSYTVNVLDKTTYYVEVFLKYSDTYSNGVSSSWLNFRQWYYKAGNENVAVTGGWVSGSASGTFSRNKTSSHLTIQVTNTSSSAILVTDSVINLAGINTLKIKLTYVTNVVQDNQRFTGLRLSANKNDASFELGIAEINQQATNTTLTLDASSINSAYLKLITAHGTIEATGISTTIFYDVWGE